MTDAVRLSAMVPVDDVKAFFKGGPWKGSWSGGSFEGSAKMVDVKIRTRGKTYGVKIESVDDPSDSDEMSTEEPLKAIAEFLGRDLPGGEHFERMSSFPAFVAHSVAMAAELIGAGLIGRSAAIRVLRRFSSVSPVAEPSQQRPLSDLSSLEKEAVRKGWKARVKKDKYGDDLLEIDVSGIYEAEVSLDSILYEYKFELRGQSKVDQSGTTDDPIREFSRWVSSPEVEEAMEAVKEVERRHREDTETRRPDASAPAPAPAKPLARTPAYRRPQEEALS